MTDTPEVLSTTTSATPIGDSIPAPATGPIATTDHDSHLDWQPDIAALSAAAGDTHVWAKQFSELVGHTTGKWIDEATFVDWLGLFATQVRQQENRAALFAVASTPVPPVITGDPGLALLDLRDEIAQQFRHGAGL